MAQPNILDYQKFSAELQKNQVENVAKRPGQNSHIAGALDEFKGQLREGGKGRRRKPWEYGMDGLVSGLSLGLKKSDSDASQKVMDYFQANTENIEEQNRYNMKKEQERIVMEPYAMTSLQLMNGELPYEQVNQQLGSIWQQAQLANPKLKGSFVSYIPNSDMINVRGDDGKVSVVPMASFIGADAYQNLRKDSLERQKLKLESDPNSIANRHKQAYIDDVNNRWDPKKKYNQNYGGQQGKNDADTLKNLVERENGIKLARFKLDEAKKLFKGGKVISGKSFAAAASRLTGEAFNTDAMSDTQAFESAVKGITGYVKNNVSWGNANMKEFQNIVGQLPLTEYTPKAVATIMDQLERLMTREFEDIYEDRQKYNDFNTKNQNSQQQPITPENPLTLTPEEQQAAGKNNMPDRSKITLNDIEEEMKRRGLA